MTQIALTSPAAVTILLERSKIFTATPGISSYVTVAIPAESVAATVSAETDFGPYPADREVTLNLFLGTAVYEVKGSAGGGAVSAASISSALDAATPAELAAIQASVSEAPFVALQRYAQHVVAGDWAPALAALFAEYALSGARIYLPLGTTVLKSWPAIPQNADAAPKQAPFSFYGSGPHWSGRGSALYGATILDLQISDTRGKIKLNGLGWFGADGVTFTDTTGSPGALVYATNTTLGLERCCFYGSVGTGINAQQDAVFLGGPNQIEAGGGWDDGFQGYGTFVRNCYFSRIRRGVYGRAFANAIVVAENTFWSNCGGATSDFAAIEFDCGTSGGVQYDTGNFIVGNLIEATNYVYCIKIGRGAGNYIAGNPIYDAHAGHSLAGVYLGPSSVSNTVITCYVPGIIEPVIDAGNPASGPNFVIATLQGKYSAFGPTKFQDPNYDTIISRLKIDRPGDFTVQPAAAQLAGARLVNFRRSAAEATTPSADIAYITYGGDFVLPTAGLYSGGNQWRSNGASGTGQNMTQDSGSGGSYLRKKNFGEQFLNFSTSAVQFTMLYTSTGPRYDKGIVWTPQASVTADLVANGNFAIEATSNTSLTLRLKGSDGVVRSAAIALT